LGREREYEIKPAAKKKKVMVVGGGPAGMEAARVAALRGHEVALYEKERWLGGSLPLAATVKGFEREDLASIVRYLERQISNLGVTINRGREVDRALVKRIKPDVLVIAAGGAHQVPNLPGIDRTNVVSGPALHKRLKAYLSFFGPRLLRRLTELYMPLGKRVVIMGGGIHGCQVAELLVKRGRKVTIVDTAAEIGYGLPDVLIKPYLLNWLRVRGVIMLPGVAYKEITDKGLVVRTGDGRQRLLEADTIVTAMPLLANEPLRKNLEGIAPEVHVIGDSREPNMIIDAIADGARIGRAV
jgi:2,4-dienoyl-CoA reductase (NADPH2)